MPPFPNPWMHLHSAQASKTLCHINGEQAAIRAGSLADSKAFDVYLVQVSNFSIPSRTQYPLSPNQKLEHQQL